MLNRLTGLATASVRRDHEVVVFFKDEGVHILNNLTNAQISRLSLKKIKLLACRTSVIEHSDGSVDDITRVAESSSLGELIEIIENCERVVFLN